jgi:hypothetical protein
MKQLAQFLVGIACVGLAGCGDQNTGSNVKSPGGNKSVKTSTLELARR